MDLWGIVSKHSNKRDIHKLSKASIRRLGRNAGIIYLRKDIYEPIRKIFNTTCLNINKQLALITKHTGKKIIKSSDFQLLTHLDYISKNISNQHAGTYDGWCDNLPGQCSSSAQCGGNDKEKVRQNYLIPHETFKRILKNNRAHTFKMTTQVVHLLHNFIEKETIKKLLHAKNIHEETNTPISVLLSH